MPAYKAPPRDLESLRAYRDEILAVAGKYGVSDIRVFGSVMRGEANAGSDVDLLVKYPSTLGWDICDCELDLSRLLHMPVQLIYDQALRSPMREIIFSEATPL